MVPRTTRQAGSDPQRNSTTSDPLNVSEARAKPTSFLEEERKALLSVSQFDPEQKSCPLAGCLRYCEKIAVAL
jgi:hypothetical protein